MRSDSGAYSAVECAAPASRGVMRGSVAQSVASKGALASPAASTPASGGAQVASAALPGAERMAQLRKSVAAAGQMMANQQAGSSPISPTAAEGAPLRGSVLAAVQKQTMVASVAEAPKDVATGAAPSAQGALAVTLKGSALGGGSLASKSSLVASMLQDAPWPDPFWVAGRGRTLMWRRESTEQSVRFQATLVQPAGSLGSPSSGPYPMVIYFSGVGSPGGLEEMNVVALSRETPRPFVLVAPFRRKGYWVLSQGGRMKTL